MQIISGFVAATADLRWDPESLTLEKIEYTELVPDNTIYLFYI